MSKTTGLFFIRLLLIARLNRSPRHFGKSYIILGLRMKGKKCSGLVNEIDILISKNALSAL